MVCFSVLRRAYEKRLHGGGIFLIKRLMASHFLRWAGELRGNVQLAVRMEVGQHDFCPTSDRSNVCGFYC